MNSILFFLIHIITYSHAFLNRYYTKKVKNSPTHLFSNRNKNIIIFGNGNVGKEVTKCLVNHKDLNTFFDCVYCTHRSTSEKDFIDGINYVTIENMTPNIISKCSHVLITIPPQISDSNYIDVVLDNTMIMNNLSKDVTIGYISTTGVYGDHNNAWVDELSNTLCTSNTKAYTYLNIEERWQSFSSKKLFIYRCAGLYGDNMSALHTILKSGYAKETDNRKQYTSRIHLKDVAHFIVMSFINDNVQSGIYNLADSLPASRDAVMQHAYKLLCDAGLKDIIQDNEDGVIIKSERKSRRKTDRKRVCNKKLLSGLNMCGSRLLFPTFYEGLQDVVDNNIDRWRK